MLFFLVNGHNDNSAGIAEQDFTSHTYQEIGQFAYTFNLTYTAMRMCIHDSSGLAYNADELGIRWLRRAIPNFQFLDSKCA